jgi:hypothetical protein
MSKSQATSIAKGIWRMEMQHRGKFNWATARSNNPKIPATIKNPLLHEMILDKFIKTKLIKKRTGTPIKQCVTARQLRHIANLIIRSDSRYKGLDVVTSAGMQRFAHAINFMLWNLNGNRRHRSSSRIIRWDGSRAIQVDVYFKDLVVDIAVLHRLGLTISASHPRSVQPYHTADTDQADDTADMEQFDADYGECIARAEACFRKYYLKVRNDYFLCLNKASLGFVYKVPAAGSGRESEPVDVNTPQTCMDPSSISPYVWRICRSIRNRRRNRREDAAARRAMTGLQPNGWIREYRPIMTPDGFRTVLTTRPSAAVPNFEAVSKAFAVVWQAYRYWKFVRKS